MGKVAWQKQIRDKEAGKEVATLFPDLHIPKNKILKRAVVKRIDFKTATPIILRYEWIGTMPLPKSCRYIYGIYFDGVLGGADIFVEPSTRQFFKKYPRQVVQLNRGACEWWTPKNTASKLLGKACKLLGAEGVKIIIAYCTPEAGEIGTIYQALGWWYVGDTAKSKSYYLDEHWVSERTLADKIKWARDKDKRWQDKFKNLPCRELSPKYKYIKILCNGAEVGKIISEYNFQRLEYPKRDKVSPNHPVLGDTGLRP